MYQLSQSLLEAAPNVENLTLAHTHWAQAELQCWIGHNEEGLSEAMKCLEIIQAYGFSTEMQRHKGLQLAYHNVAETLIWNRKFSKALSYENHSIQALQSIPDWEKKYNSVVAPMCNKCLCLWQLGEKSNLEEASELLSGILATGEREYGKDDTLNVFCGWALYELGNVKVAQGLEDEALELYLRTYHQYLESHGSLHFRTAAVLTKIGIRYYRRGDFAKAK